MTLATTEASIKASVGAALHKIASIFSTVKTALDTAAADVNKIAPAAEFITSLIPGGAGAAAAEAAIVAIINAVDAAVDAAGSQAAGGVTVSLPAQLVADFTAAKTAILANAKAL